MRRCAVPCMAALSVYLPHLSTVELPDEKHSSGGQNTAMSNLSDILDRIDQRLSVVGLTDNSASLAAGKSDAIRNMRRALREGSRQGVTVETLAALAVPLKTSTAWLVDGVGNAEAVRVPLISWVSAGSPDTPTAVEEIQNARRIEDGELDPKGDWVALEVIGDSMDRISPPGSIIFVDRNDRRLVMNACYVIALENGEATYKRFRPSPDRFEPVSVNPMHEPFYPEGPVSILGRVRKTMLPM